MRSTLSDRMRLRFHAVLDAASGFLLRLGIPPTALTLAGLLGHVLAGALAMQGLFRLAGLLLLVVAPFDALDGSMARLKGEASPWGAFVDSVVDRYAELFLYGGLLLFYQRSDHPIYGLLVYLAAAGSVLVSYTRARAEGVGLGVKTGLLTRLERYVLLIPSLILVLPHVGVAAIAVLANVTALQRIAAVRQLSREVEFKGENS